MLGGHQPLIDPWGGVTVLNGELYEPERVLAELGSSLPEGASDTFAMAALLHHRGPEGLRGVRGAFAAARYTPGDGTLLLVRDAVGQKPLYVHRSRAADEPALLFGSTVRSIAAVVGLPPIREEAIFEYLCLRSVGGMHSAFVGIEQLPPGGWLSVDASLSERSGRWWSPPPVTRQDAPTQELRECLSNAVQSRLWTGAELGLFLSGGLDSSIVAHLARDRAPELPMRAYFIGYDVPGTEDERGHAARIAAELGLDVDELVLAAKSVPDLLEDVAAATEDPIQDPVTLPTLVLCRAARERTKVVLTGDGSDEIWGGYERFTDVPQDLSSYLRRAAIFQPEELGLEGFPASYLDDVDPGPATPDPLDRVLRLEVLNRMRNYHLSRIDKISGSVGLEARSPFLDVQLLDLGLSLSARAKRPGVPKGLLIAAFVDALPEWLVARKKQPFSVPILQWIEGPLHDYTQDTLRNPLAACRQWVAPDSLLDGLGRTPALAGRIWSLLQFEAWVRVTQSWRRHDV
jgi:asparagine synthase (glutamine-hydrolysing)